MAEFPALPFFTDAYLADTRHLTTEEHGAYLLLLMCAWRTRGCSLRDDDKSLSRIAGLSPTKWRRMRPVVAQFFHIEGGYWRQKKLLQVYEGVAERVARNRKNGARGGQASAANRVAKKAATKSKTKTKPKAANVGEAARPEMPDDNADISEWQKAAADVFASLGVDIILDPAVFHFWMAAGVDPIVDMVPTLKAVLARPRTVGAKPPQGLGYFREAVLDAQKTRVQATTDGKSRAPVPPKPQKQKRVFNAGSVDDWRLLLGAPESRFRGDYMAKNWHIPSDHPVFRTTELGPNPRLSKTNHLPVEIMQQYRRAWAWL